MLRALVALSVLCSTLAFGQEEEVSPLAAVQERTYRMQHEFALGVGVLPIDPYTKGLFAQFGYTAHFTDTFAWNVARGGYSYSLKTELRNQLERDFGFLPTAFEEVQFFVGTDVVWTPVYGKLSIANKWDLHGEFFLYVGATLFKYTLNFRPGVNLGLGGRVFFNRALSLRLDLTDDVVIPTGAASPNLGNVMQLSLSLALNLGATE
ncbi:MAG: outer membrane beta-barrel domain-containing protein [Myxococcota bacterium]